MSTPQAHIAAAAEMYGADGRPMSTDAKYAEVKAYAVKQTADGVTFLDAAPGSPIGQKALATGEFFVNSMGTLEQS